MECKVSELVKRGHDQAAELKSSCGAVSQLISDLATQLDCTALALREMTKKRDADHADVLAWEKTMFKACGEDGLKSVAEKFAELQDRCAALAAENAGLKAFGDKLYSMYKGLDTSGGGFHDEQSIPYQQAAIDAAISAFEEIKTPETDASMAEVRASAIPDEATERDLFEEWVMEKIFISKTTLEGLRTDDGYRNSTLSGTDYNGMWSQWKAIRAAQLRKGVQS